MIGIAGGRYSGPAVQARLAMPAWRRLTGWCFVSGWGSAALHPVRPNRQGMASFCGLIVLSWPQNSPRISPSMKGIIFALSGLLLTCSPLFRTPILAAEGVPSAYLAFACDGTAREQRVLQEQSVSWIINQTRASGPPVGRVVYRVPVGNAQLERLQFEVNLVPYRLEFSGDGNRWETLISTSGIASNPAQFKTQSLGFTAAQREAARASGCAWFSFRPAGKSPSETLQLKYIRLDVYGAELPLQFVRPSWWRQFAPFAPGALMVMVGAVAVWIVWRRWCIPCRVWGGGAALWAVSVALKFGFAMLANRPLYRWLHAELAQTWANPAYWSYVGLLTGVFECGIFLVAAPLIKRRQWSWREALSLGVGFGAVEALAVGAVASFAASQAGAWGCVTTWSEALVPAFERLLALLIHVAAVVMILRALVDRKWQWFGVSFAYKSAVDGVAGWVILSGTSLQSSPWLRECICVAPFALIGVLALFKLRRRWMKPSQPERKNG